MAKVKCLRMSLNVVGEMMIWDPEDRLHSWEAKMDLSKALDPQGYIGEAERATSCIQSPTSKALRDGVQTAFHRAAIKQDKSRIIRS